MEGSHVQDVVGPFCLFSGLPSPQSRASPIRRNQDEADVRFSPALSGVCIWVPEDEPCWEQAENTAWDDQLVPTS